MLIYQCVVCVVCVVNIKKSYKNNGFKISAPTWNKNLNYPMDHILYQDSRLFWIILKIHETVTDNPSIRIYINKIESSITFKINTGCYFELLTNETVKLLGSTKSKITKDKNSENLPHLEITEVELIHCNIVNNDP